MSISLMKLPYPQAALEPHISAETIKVHHGAHHKGYVAKVNKAIEGTDMSGLALEEIVAVAKKSHDANLFNSAAQAWNHGFYWHSLAPRKTTPSRSLQAAIERDFGSLSQLLSCLSQEAEGHFASGWTWLVAKGETLQIVSTSDADTIITGKANPLLTIDVWEHAYYLDVKNKRPDYVRRVVKSLLNWEFASENFDRGSPWSYPA